ncbi:MAG: hypothetical protein H7196_03485 [candidate division SR1 bacterium]|nr:hypothetical protein [candidate division SR1 bacterium]
MKKFTSFGLFFLSISVLFSSHVVAQTITPNTVLQNQYSGGYTPPINNINNGIQGSIGYGGSQCGTSVSFGATSSPGITNSISVIDNSNIHGSNTLGAQVMITHNISNPCMSQKDQICTIGKIQLVQNNPTMSLDKLKELLALLINFADNK